jgi:hypothetical protein
MYQSSYPIPFTLVQIFYPIPFALCFEVLIHVPEVLIHVPEVIILCIRFLIQVIILCIRVLTQRVRGSYYIDFVFVLGILTECIIVFTECIIVFTQCIRVLTLSLLLLFKFLILCIIVLTQSRVIAGGVVVFTEMKFVYQ